MKNSMLTLLNTHGTMIAKVTMKKKNKIVLLNIEINVPKYLKTCVKDETWLWHIRLGYASFDNLKIMMQKEILKGLSSIEHPNQLCEEYLVGKQFCKSFPKESTSS
jgi:hypothetical protein